MMQNWKLLGWQMALAAALTMSPARAAQLDGPAPAEPDKTDAVVKQLQELKKALEDAEKRLKASIESLETSGNLRFAKLQTDVEDMKKQLGQLSRLQADTDELKRQIAQLRQEFDGLRTRMQPTISGYGPATNGTGRIRLVNTFPDQMTVVVNDRAYRLAPGQTQLTDPLPAGNFRYMVLGVQPEMQNRLLAANETFTITIHPL